MPTSTLIWLIVTVILFLIFAGWVWHEIRSVGRRQLAEDWRHTEESGTPEG